MEQWQSEHPAAYKQIVQWIKVVRKSGMYIENMVYLFSLHLHNMMLIKVFVVVNREN